MLKKAELSHISRLNHIGRQLGVLSRLYTSYGALIDSVLEKQEASLASLKNSHILDSPGVGSMMSSQMIVPTAIEMLGVSLSSASRVRFERLKHRIDIYALSELKECISQKDSLVMMNFNLIAIKESYSVERLTRITLLLAKVTMLFMPVSLMTAYFSCQLQDVDFTVKSYWTWFSVVLSVTIAGLVGFSAISGTMEGKMYYVPWSKKFWRAIRGTDTVSERSKSSRESGFSY
jgi:Mg2+ and Co2+ transporter CorA